MTFEMWQCGLKIYGSFWSFAFFFFFGYLFYTKKFCEATELEPRFSPSFASELKEGPDQEGYIISSC